MSGTSGGSIVCRQRELAASQSTVSMIRTETTALMCAVGAWSRRGVRRDKAEGRGGEGGLKSGAEGELVPGLDELVDVFVLLEHGPCAAPTVRRLDREEVTPGTSHACSGGGGGGTNQGATRETRRTGRRTLPVCATGSVHAGAQKILSCHRLVTLALG